MNISKIRVNKFFLNLEDAEKFSASLSKESNAILVPVLNMEDKARGYSHPRIQGYKVIYYSEIKDI